ncbi:TonB-dependent receptor [Sphingomonas flavalba]|uniref:TonB-dependent receptor n=1 Tax=Sphingomonas flavalba TaxID=2559804 RepID=UPI00109DAB4A|nr:TonB-dependent receptor [Sphingomonas flavalba]
MRNISTKTVLLAAAAPLALLLPAQAPAQDGPAEEVIIVTGSRLPSTDLTGAAPLTVLDRGEIEATGAQSVGELLRELPVASASASDSAGRGNNGSANIALRGLSAVNTLVLVNGRRVLSNSDGGTVDLNSIPFEAIDRMEVLQDGASAVYGSDAIAGVVNIIMRRSYDGLQLKAGYGVSSRGDLPNYEASGTYGKEYDGGGFVFNVSYRKSGGNVIADRPVSRDPDWRALGGRNFRDEAPLVGAFKAVDPANAFGAGNPYYILRDGVAQATSAADLRPMVYPGTNTPITSGNDGINYWEYESSASKISQVNLWFSGHQEIGNDITAFVETSYNSRNSLGFLAPDYFDPSSGTNPGLGNGVIVSAANQFNPFGFDVFAIRTLQELGKGRTRMNDVNSKVYRIVAGLEGKFTDAWKWDVSANFQKLDMFRNGGRSLDIVRLQRAVGDPALCAATAGCIPVNVFGGPGSVTEAMLNSLTSPRWTNTQADLKSVIGNVTGKLFELPAGDVSVALGAEYRTESFSQIQDNAPEKTTPTPPFLPPTRKIYEFYAETAVPLLRDIPGIYSLDIEGAVRYSHYNAFGSTTNPKAGVKWRPYSDLLVRGSWGTGFRAPTFAEANSTQSRGYRPLTDPCQGAEYASYPVCGGRRAPVLTGAWVVTGGNPNLRPETAKTLTIGAVWTPKFIPRFSATVDFFRITKSNIIGVADPDYIIQQNALNAGFAGQVVRDPNNSIYEVYAVRDNLLDQSIKGLDFGVEYNTGEMSWGSINLRADATYTDSYKLSPAPATPAVERVGTYTTALGTIAKWKATGRVTWALDDLQVTYGTRYVGPVRNDASLLVNGARLRAKSYMQHDIAVSYFVEPMQVKLTAAVDNFTDRMPPWLEGNYFNGFDEKTFNSRGRFFSFRIAKDF